VRLSALPNSAWDTLSPISQAIFAAPYVAIPAERAALAAWSGSYVMVDDERVVGNRASISMSSCHDLSKK
jgi:hypothetical protein